ncbi:AlbA family DNA-binding domain-containing protein [Clostridium sp. DL1XJH146]
MDTKKLSLLLKQQENIKLDFKLKLDLSTESGRKEFAKDVCAIANSPGGRGYLIIGIEDKTKKVVGINVNDYTEEQVQQIVSSRIEPPIPIKIETIIYYGQNVSIITIYSSDQRPHQVRETGAFYIRRGSTTDTMRKEELIGAFQDNLSLGTELCPIIKSTKEALNFNLVEAYFKNHSIEINDSNREMLLTNTGIITKESENKNFKCTMGGLLVFSSINYLYIPHNIIKVINRINENYDDIIIIQGDLLSMLDKSKKLISEILPSNYPWKAVYEGIKNAVLYRDYTVYNKETEVVIDYKNISVISPGILVKNGKGSIENSHSYIRRNMWIYEKLITLDKENRFNKSTRGFTRMKKSFENHGKVKFLNVIKENKFKVIFPGIKNYN